MQRGPVHALRLMERRMQATPCSRPACAASHGAATHPHACTSQTSSAPATTVRRAHARTSRITYPLGPTSRRAGHRVTRTCRGDRVTQLRAAQFPISEPVDASKSHRGGVSAAGCCSPGERMSKDRAFVTAFSRPLRLQDGARTVPTLPPRRDTQVVWWLSPDGRWSLVILDL